MYEKQLQISNKFQSGKSPERLARTFTEVKSVIQLVLNQQLRIWKAQSRNSSVLDKLVLLDNHGTGIKILDIRSKCKIAIRKS